MKIKIADIIEKYGMDYTTAISLDIKGISEISFEEAMHLDGRGVVIDSEQDIYTNDLAQEERKLSLSTIFESMGEQM